jgi:GT2 family glycosyltransferase
MKKLLAIIAESVPFKPNFSKISEIINVSRNSLEDYFMYMEDLDWSRRFWEKGYKVAYVGQAEIIHLHRRQSAAESILKTLFSKTARHHIISFVKYLLKFRAKELPNLKS